MLQVNEMSYSEGFVITRQDIRDIYEKKFKYSPDESEIDSIIIRMYHGNVAGWIESFIRKE